MTDFNTYLMLDDTNLSIEAAHAADASAFAGYVNGKFANWAALVAKYGKSGKHLLSIDVSNNPGAGAQCLDIEQGDATNADAPGWFKATHAAGVAAKDLRYYPKLYTSESNLKDLVDTMAKAGVARDSYMLWSAHYTGKSHICGPKSCGSTVQADATQWTDKYKGASLDASLCYGYFFAGAPANAPVTPVSAPVKAPAIPGHGATVPADTTAEISFSGVSGATGYHVQVIEGDSIPSTPIFDENVTATSVKVTGLKPNTKYSWRVGTNSGSQFSGFSGLIHFTTTPPAPKPFAAPEGLTETTHVTHVFEWKAVPALDGKSPSDYKIQAVQNNGKVGAETTVTGLSAALELVKGWEYEIRVWAEGGEVAPPHASLKITA